MPTKLPIGIPIWHLLILDRAPKGPRWLLCTLAPGDAHPADVSADGAVNLTEGHAWCRDRLGAVALEELSPGYLAWHVR